MRQVSRKLSDDQVEILVSDPRTLKAIAADYGVSVATVSLIKNGKLRATATGGRRDVRDFRSLAWLKCHPCIAEIARTLEGWHVTLTSGWALFDDVPTASGFVRRTVTEFDRPALRDVTWEIRQGWVRPV